MDQIQAFELAYPMAEFTVYNANFLLIWLMADTAHLPNPIAPGVSLRLGKQAIGESNDEKLRVCINQLVELLPPANKKDVRFGGTGIG